MLTATQAYAMPLAARRSTLEALVAEIDDAVEEAPADALPQAVGAALRRGVPVADLLDRRQRQGEAGRYVRHVVHADPLGRYTLVALVWRPGQITPVHGHYTWCAYTILQGEMHEEQFAWRAADECAVPSGSIARVRGDVATSHAGLDRIHRLSNGGAEVAISLHVYGVSGARVATHVNRIAALA